MSYPKVAVLLSTYNGEKYLKEQLDSIFNQKEVVPIVYVRDDGSTDKTVEILKNYQTESIYVIPNNRQNLGVGASFMTIVYQAGYEYDYYAFCDQDDVWSEYKLKQAIDKLDDATTPSLYCSNQTLVDKNLNEIGKRHEQPINTSYLQVLMNNKITGCTMVWNKSLQTYLCREQSLPSEGLLKVRIHDVWVAMVASLVGHIIYDQQSYIYYRQHEQNVVGVRKTPILLNWIRKLKNTDKQRGRSRLASEILTCYGDVIDDEVKEKLSLFSTYRFNISNKYRLLRHQELFQFSNESKLGIAVKILFNLI